MLTSDTTVGRVVVLAEGLGVAGVGNDGSSGKRGLSPLAPEVEALGSGVRGLSGELRMSAKPPCMHAFLGSSG